MSVVSIQLDQQPGSSEISTPQCKILCLRPRPGVAVVQIIGIACGSLYEALFNHLEPDLVSDAPVELFVDTRSANGSAINIVDWVNFISQDHGLFECVHVLVASTVISLSVNIIKHLSRTGDLIQIYTEPATYNRHLQRAMSRRNADRRPSRPSVIAQQ